MVTTRTISGEALHVRPAHHARVTFDTPAPAGCQVIIDHLRAGERLARECRPLSKGARFLDIKTHPEAAHVACSMQAAGRALDGVRFRVECGEAIQAIARHFIVIGAMKAGTTSLFQLLAQHPAICRTGAHHPGVSYTKEINYFSHIYRKVHTPLHYDWRFPFDPGRHAWTLDVSPNYAKWPASRGVAPRIASLGGDTRLAYILREPIDRIESHIAHNLHVRGEARHLAHCIRTSRYAMQLDKFTAHFGRDRILLLDFEQLQRDPGAITAQVCDFLGIPRFAARSGIHNRRRIPFRLDRQRRAELLEQLRPDVERLISVYGYKPAEKWLSAPRA